MAIMHGLLDLLDVVRGEERHAVFDEVELTGGFRDHQAAVRRQTVKYDLLAGIFEPAGDIVPIEPSP